jgi:NTE family protein
LNAIKRHLTFITFTICCFYSYSQQKVGLVLSGGGATGFAHIGVLKALEERGIPIDYITGTSAGALVGSMYAIGFSPEEIEAYVLNEEFQMMTKGKIDASRRFVYREDDINASLLDVSFSKDSILSKSLPTNFITSSYLDFEMMKFLGTTIASYDNQFDNLFVPFRCVASDITNKKSIVYSSGNLQKAVRASMTYPFYLNPIRINGLLLFDGGLYDNFPAGTMYNEFNPDYIIGSNVSYNAAPPSENSLISQLTNMLVSYSSFELPCEAGYIIEPKTEVTTFNFDGVQQAILDGYNSTLVYLDSIEIHMERKVTKEELTAKRLAFRSKIIPLNVSSISNNFNKKKDIRYARASMMRVRKEEILSAEQIEQRYFRLYATPQIDFIYPSITLKKDSTYNLDLEVRKAKDFKLDVGGHFSSRAVNTGFIGLTYRTIGKLATSFHGESYFGKFYGSIKTNITTEIPSIFPISGSAYFVMNRWDYFKSFATFFEDVKPSFLIQNEMYYGLKFKHPIGNTIKSTIDFRLFNIEDDYYQTDEFTNKDTTDFTTFDGGSISWEFVQNSLNRKQFASGGHFVQVKVRYVNGKEQSTPGSTSPQNIPQSKLHSWINVNAEFQSFLINKTAFHFGLHGKGVFNSQSLFSNYTATLLAMTSFSPIADAETYFLPEYRSPQHVGAGFNMIFTFNKNVDLRFDGYYYQPFVQLIRNDDGTPSYSKPFKGDLFIASSSLIYHSIIGPIRATVNYFPKQTAPIAFQISYGWVLFNERAIR